MRIEERNQTMEYILSFSHEQNMEDIILYHALQRRNIFWIDVGANDPVFDSVTKFFSTGGGYGINIEPQPQYTEKYTVDRPNDINLAIGISDTHGKMKLYGKGELASFDASSKNVSRINFCNIPVWTLTEVCDKYIKHGQEIHLLKIDVEGWEKQCLRGMDFSKYRPWILCIEAAEPNPDNPGYTAWESIIIRYGYVFAGKLYANRYYVLAEKKDIIERFKDIGHLEKYYDITFWSERERYKKYVQILQSRTLAPLRWMRNCVKRIIE